ncbi:unnamed protein product [Angiostrongylus costaricensis]|uniref:Sulfate_transp domain-containing protein n=1 Tax=Angiostrongylus costaricensis TaxID=334426 RepID=A0A0R3PT41_ANGCS|nr:unnamed protein product [Angiostrongylus costaricensis]
MKAGCTITVAIAFDRVRALYFPLHYYQQRKAYGAIHLHYPLINIGHLKEKHFECPRSLRHSLFFLDDDISPFGDVTESKLSRNVVIEPGAKGWSVGALVFSLVLTFIDWIVLQLTVTIEPVPGCGSFGCFTNEVFRAYWGLSNMVVNLIACLLTLANRVAIYILLVSATIGVIPGCLNGVTTIVNLSLKPHFDLKLLNPVEVNVSDALLQVLTEVSFFVGASATLSGLSHAFIFGIAHRDIKYTILNKIFKHGAIPPSAEIEMTSHIAVSSYQRQVHIQ